MSYSQQDADSRTPRSGRKSNPTTPRGGDAFDAESRKVQEAVRKIQQHAADVRKEANLLNTAPSHGMAKGKEKSQSAVREAKATTETAMTALHGLARATTGGLDGKALTVEEQNSRKFMHQKLAENLSASVKALDQAWMAYQAAEAEAVRQQAPPSTMATPLVTAGAPGIDPALPPEEPERDLEVSQQGLSVRELSLRQEQDVTPAEAEMHAAIAEEYANDMMRVAENTQALQRAMNELAETTTAQGSILDDIESNMSQAVESTAQANEELAVTSQTQQRGTKRFMWLLVVAGSLAAVGALFT